MGFSGSLIDSSSQKLSSDGPCPQPTIAESTVGVRLTGGLLHLYGHAHPGMNAALKLMFALRQPRDVDAAALQNSRLGHGHSPEATGTFRNGCFSSVQAIDEASAEVGNFCERVGLSALV